MKHTRMRPAEPMDMLALHRLLAAQNKRDRTSYPMPLDFDEAGHQAGNVPLALVVEHGGDIDGAIIFEAMGKGVEMMLVGCSPRVTVMAEKDRNAIEYTLRGMGFVWIRCLITRSVVKHLKSPMKEAGFRRTDMQFASFFKEI